MILPASYIILSSVLDVGRQPVASGSSGNIYEGTLNGSRVCVKRIRIHSEDGPQGAIKVHFNAITPSVFRYLRAPPPRPSTGRL